MQLSKPVSPFAALVDAWALALAHATHDSAPGLEKPSSGVSPTAPFVRASGTPSMTAITAATHHLLEATQHREPAALTANQLHYLFAIAAADFLEPAGMAAFLEHAVDPGVAIAYEPISVSALRLSIGEVLDSFPQAERPALLLEILEQNHVELLQYAPAETVFSEAFITWGRTHPNPSIRRLAFQRDDPAALAPHAPGASAIAPYRPGDRVSTDAGGHPTSPPAKPASVVLDDRASAGSRFFYYVNQPAERRIDHAAARATHLRRYAEALTATEPAGCVIEAPAVSRLAAAHAAIATGAPSPAATPHGATALPSASDVPFATSRAAREHLAGRHHGVAFASDARGLTDGEGNGIPFPFSAADAADCRAGTALVVGIPYLGKHYFALLRHADGRWRISGVSGDEGRPAPREVWHIATTLERDLASLEPAPSAAQYQAALLERIHVAQNSARTAGPVLAFE